MISRVPGKNAFDNVKRMPPPNLPGYEEDLAAYNAKKQGGAPPKEPAGAGGRKPPQREKPSGGQPRSHGQLPPAQARKRSARNKRPVSRTNRPVSPAKRRRNRRIAAVLAIIVLIGAGVGFCFGFLFKIESYTVYGDSPYTKDEIVAAFHPREGDNMFGFSAGEEARDIEQQLPYLSKVTVRRRLPSTIVFQVEAATEKYGLLLGEQYAILSDTRKVLRFADALPEGLTEIRGLTEVRVEPGFPLESTWVAGSSSAAVPSSSTPDSSTSTPDSSAPTSSAPTDGSTADTSADTSQPASSGSATQDNTAPSSVVTTDKLELLDTLLSAIDASGLGDITWVDVSDPLSLQFRWQDRITVKLGPKGDIAEKLNFVVVLFTDPNRGQIGQADRGTLDVSGYPGVDRVYLAPE